MVNVKIYDNGIDFYNDNKDLIEDNIIRTIFIKLNSLCIKEINRNNYCIKISNNNDKLIALNMEPYNLLIFGCKYLIKTLAEVLFYNNFNFKGLQCSRELYDEFCKEYSLLTGGSFEININLNLLTSDCKQQIEFDNYINSDNAANYKVYKSSINDYEEIVPLIEKFDLEIFGEKEANKEKILSEIDNYRYTKEDGKIVSIAMKSKNQKGTCSISYVYTLPEYRGKGYAKKIVSTLRDEIIDENKVAYLNVDNFNPISSHIYYSIGFKKLENTINSIYINNNINRSVFAGGCFWCLANSFYSLDGVIKVVSGYCGGRIVNPSYSDVKRGETGHKESILVIYDKDKITFDKLLKVYFENIDPFDGDGQFIDRGNSYKCAVFTDNINEIDVYNKYLNIISKKYKKDVKVELLNNNIFYHAEDEHQNYSLKNKELFQNEESISGRKDFKNIKIDEE